MPSRSPDPHPALPIDPSWPSLPRQPVASRVRLHGWRHPAILSAALLAVAAGFAQFVATAALSDVAAAFGETGPGGSITEQVGLNLTTLGLGLAVIRLASLASMPLAALADRVGRRRVILSCCLGGLALTVLAAFSPTFWWFVVIFAVGRPLLSATNTLAVVIAAEQTQTADRAKAIALLAAAYGVGAGIATLARGIWGLGFRPLFALAAVPLVLVAVTGRRVEEPDRYARLSDPDAAVTTAIARPGRVPAALRSRLALLAGLGFFAFGFVMGPVTTLLFLYSESVLGLSKATTSLVVLCAAPIGLGGLLAGRWAADTLGRIPTAIAAHTVAAIAGAVTYTGGAGGAIGGYLVSLFAQSAFGTAVGALSTELFPTSSRGTAAGWLNAAGVLGAVLGLLTFGLLVDAFGSFGPAALAVAIPVALAGFGYLRLPETRSLDLEDFAPDSVLEKPMSTS
ncbi:MAG: MFS transporter [Egibacteraceae bacterium]